MTEPSLLTSVGVKSMNPTGTPSDWMLGAAKARAGPPSLACIHPVRQIASNHFLMGALPLQVRLDGDRHRQRERKAYHHAQRHLHNYWSVGRRSRNGRQHSKRQAADLLQRPPAEMTVTKCRIAGTLRPHRALQRGVARRSRWMTPPGNSQSAGRSRRRKRSESRAAIELLCAFSAGSPSHSSGREIDSRCPYAAEELDP